MTSWRPTDSTSTSPTSVPVPVRRCRVRWPAPTARAKRGSATTGGPTWVLGKYDMVVLEEPAYSDECWVEGDRGCSWPPSIVNVSVSKAFADSASPEMVEFLRAYEMDQILVSQLLAYMRGQRRRGRRRRPVLPGDHAGSVDPVGVRRRCGPRQGGAQLKAEILPADKITTTRGAPPAAPFLRGAAPGAPRPAPLLPAR